MECKQEIWCQNIHRSEMPFMKYTPKKESEDLEEVYFYLCMQMLCLDPYFLICKPFIINSYENKKK